MSKSSARRTRRVFIAEFKAKVALAALIMMLIVGQNLLNLSALLRGKCAGLASDATLAPQGIEEKLKAEIVSEALERKW